jgi:phosphatidylethanolamine/phosphatidyl-N-methylethanolamine N-methyltransferase
MARKPLTDSLRFLRGFLTRPRLTGAVLPSSRYLAAAMLDGLALESASCVAELGPGTGVFTEALVDRCSEGCTVISIERDAEFESLIRERFSGVHSHEAGADELVEIAAGHNGLPIDAVISGLPWAVFPEALQESILDAVLASLKPGGELRTFAYVHALKLAPARRFRALLEARFERVELSRTVWRNTPPAKVYSAIKAG